ncbi:hypothetical protein HPB50_013668 [Hyalomma asiaticum]|uniref:Uncharacterized protein n=1 Tax=Hyalomma asiaticum TaxID=266040 RepID=A0ACB7TI30_HYAAI|nr:hypothetical protein HPB50_013668 [Hyalomma asiaticum]
MDPLLPARLREAEKGNNCDVAKYLERGEDRSLGSSPTPQSSARSDAPSAGDRDGRVFSPRGVFHKWEHETPKEHLQFCARITTSQERVTQLPRRLRARFASAQEGLEDVGSYLRRNSSRTDLFQPSALNRTTSYTDIYRDSPVRRTTSKLASETETKKRSTLETYYYQLGEGLQKQAGYSLRRESSLSKMYNFSGTKGALKMTDPNETDMFAEHRE